MSAPKKNAPSRDQRLRGDKSNGLEVVATENVARVRPEAQRPHPYAARPLQERIDALRRIPEPLRDARRWLLFVLKPKGDGKWDKLPHYVGTGRKRSGTQGTAADRAHLVTLREALAAWQAAPDRWDGVGFAVLPPLDGEPPVGIVDLDGAEGMEQGRALLDATWAEQSVGGSGAHAVLLGDLGLPSRKAPPVELFAASGFVAMTGLPLPGNADRAPLQAAAGRALLPAALRQPRVATSNEGKPPPPWTPELRKEIDKALQSIPKGTDLGYWPWCSVGMGLHWCNPEPDGPAFALWDKHSKRWAEYKGTADLLKHWRTFGRRKDEAEVTLQTVFYVASQCGDYRMTDPTVDFKEVTDDDLDKFCHAWGDERDRELPPLRFLIEGMLAEGTGYVFARPKAGKTALLVQLVVALAAGLDALWGCKLTGKPLRVIAFLLEGPRVLNRNRIRDAERWLALDEQQRANVRRNLHVPPRQNCCRPDRTWFWLCSRFM